MKGVYEELDAVIGNFDVVKKQVSNLIDSEKKKYALVFEKYVSEAFNQGVLTAARDLSMDAQNFFDTGRIDAVRKVLVDNAVTINFELFDAINKEIVLFMTDLELNNIPFTNAGLKKEVQRIFNDKISRLQTQVITETSRAANQGIAFGYKESGLIVNKQWVAILDERTSSICRRLNGEITQIGYPFSTGDYQPPAHPGCRSRISLITLSEVNKFA